MSQISTKTVTVANQGNAMEAETIQKNEASLKNQMNMGNFIIYGLLLLIFCGFTNKAIGQSWNLNNGTLTINDNSAFSMSPYPWANNVEAITKLSIGSGVTTIPSGAFAGYLNLTTVRIEDGGTVLSFGGNYFSQISAFNGTPINNLYLGRNFTVENGNEPFYGNTGLKNLTIGNTVTAINSSSFENCTSLVTVIIGSNVTSIGSSAFQNCIELSSVNIPNSITEIDDYAFNDCASLGNIIIPKYVTFIGNGAFAGCNSLTSVNIEDGTIVLSFGGSYFSQISAFENSPINNLYLGRNYTVGNGNEPFYGNTGLKNLTIGNTVTAINSSSFENCTSLATVIIGSSVTSIGSSAFQNCIELSSSNIPNSITEIDNYAFNDCASLESIIIPKYVTSIGNGAFASCTSLTSVNIEDGTIVLSFGGSYFSQISAFMNSPINNLYLGRNYTVGNSNEPFSGNAGLKNLTIGQNVTTINDYSFSNCIGLTQITSNATMPPTVQANTFNGVNKSIPIYINCNYLTAYQTAKYWSEFTNYQCTPDFVVINGVNWATRNVDKPGKFATNPEDAGMFYQWNRKVGWSATDPLINSNGGTTWNSSTPTGTIWEKLNDPSPDSCHVPTSSEIQTLLDATRVTNEYASINGVGGRKFTDINTGNSIFLPCPNYRFSDGSRMNGVGNLLLYGVYWSNMSNTSPYDYNAYSLNIFTLSNSMGIFSDKVDGFSVRSVKDSSDTTDIKNISATRLSIYPNPVKDEIFINSESFIKKVEIYSLTGNLLLSDNIFDGKISVSTLLRGVYLLKVYTDKGVTINKIVKE